MSLSANVNAMPGGEIFTAGINVRVSATVPKVGPAASVAKMFGLSGPTLRDQVLYCGLELSIACGHIVAIVGPSGAGKSLFLTACEKSFMSANGRRLRCVRLRPGRLAGSAKRAVDILGHQPLSKRMEILSRCGLADAKAMVTPAKFLSGGELYRLALAEAIWQASERDVALIIADEFGSSLDAVTAEGLCRRLRSMITGSNMAMLVATTRYGLIEHLQPDRVIVRGHSPSAPVRILRRPRRQADAPAAWRIVRGTIRDYDCLGEFHYLAGRPAAHKRVYVIKPPRLLRRGMQAHPPVAAVLVVSPPLMNCRGRNAAVGNRYVLSDRREAMSMLNDEIECISRVIVHPVYRGDGLAVRLVRHALGNAEAPMVECLAAMGAVHPLFERAGMRSFGEFPGRHNRKYVYYLSKLLRWRRRSVPLRKRRRG